MSLINRKLEKLEAQVNSILNPVKSVMVIQDVGQTIEEAYRLEGYSGFEEDLTFIICKSIDPDEYRKKNS